MSGDLLTGKLEPFAPPPGVGEAQDLVGMWAVFDPPFRVQVGPEADNDIDYGDRDSTSAVGLFLRDLRADGSPGLAARNPANDFVAPLVVLRFEQVDPPVE